MSYQLSITKYLLRHIEDDHRVHKWICRLISEHDVDWLNELASKSQDNSIFTWGKYKGKDIAEVFAFDKNYCLWMVRQEYCSRIHRDIIQNLSEN